LGSFLIIRPWVREAFPVWDFAEVLPLLRGSHGIWGAFHSIADFYRAQGRANYLCYLQIALSWFVAGDDSLGWQLLRALLMLVAGVLLLLAARRLGATPLAAAVATAVFLVSVPATEGWLLLMGEPLALILLLLLVLAAAGYRVTPAWRGRAVVIALLAAGVMLSKEALGLCLPPVVLLALCWEPGQGLRRPRFGSRERWLGVLLLLVMVAEAWSVRAALHGAVAGSYASAFGREGLDASRSLTLFQAMLLPARFSSAPLGSVLYPANLGFLLLLVLGLARPEGGARRNPAWFWWALGLLYYPAVGALAYAFWPRYSAFYGIPFFAASAGLLALAASGIERGHRAGRWVVAVLGSLVFGFTAIVSARTVGQKHATARLAEQIARSFANSPRLDTVLVVNPRQGGRRWPITGLELRHYALAIGVPDASLPVLRDAACEEVAGRLRGPLGRSGVLNDQNPCGRLRDPSASWTALAGYLDWLSGRRVVDTIRVDMVAPVWKR